jgi:hypothetical protein
VRRTGRSRKLVREIVRGGGGHVFRCRSNVLLSHLAWLDAEWSAGCRNGAELWRRLQTTAGFRGSLRVVTEWATRRRRAETTGGETLRKPPPGRVLSRLLLSERDQLTKGDAITVARIERGVPALVSARDLVERFHRMVRDRDPAALPAWITDAAGSVLASFGKGLVADQDAVAAAMIQPWSNGQTEGQITKLKLVKRQMCGRAKLDLLRACLLAPAQVPAATTVSQSSDWMPIWGPVCVRFDNIGAQVFSDDSTINIVESRANFSVGVNANTGLVGMATLVGDNGLKFDTLLNPTLRVNSIVVLDNAGVNIAAGATQSPIPGVGQSIGPNIKQFGFYVDPSRDGTYQAIVVEHTGDSRGGPWYTHVQAWPSISLSRRQRPCCSARTHGSRWTLATATEPPQLPPDPPGAGKREAP